MNNDKKKFTAKSKILSIIMICILSLSLAINPSYAQMTAKVTINGVPLATDTNAVIRNNRTMVPFRAIFESLGANEIIWDAPTETVLASDGSISLKMQIGSYELYVNGNKTLMDTPPIIINGRTMVPLRMVSENMGADVKWDAKTYTVHVAKNTPITTNNAIFGDLTSVNSNSEPNITGNNVSKVDIIGYFAIQDLQNNRYVINFKEGGLLDIKKVGTPGQKSGTFTATGNSLTINSEIFSSISKREDFNYKNRVVVLLTSPNLTYAMTKITAEEYNSYIK